MINPIDPLGVFNGKLKADYNEKILASATPVERMSWTKAYLNAILLSYIYWIVLVIVTVVVLINLGVSF